MKSLSQFVVFAFATLTLVRAADAALPQNLETLKVDCRLDYVRQEMSGAGFGQSIVNFTGANRLTGEQRQTQIEVDALTEKAMDFIFESCARVRFAETQPSSKQKNSL
jgi:hypothetical protein